MIVACLAESVKTYKERFLHFLDNLLVCPICQGECRPHAWRERRVRTKEALVILLVLRIICPRCNRTFTILPDFLSPRKRYIQDIRQEAILAQLAGVPAERVVETARGPSVETVRRWLAEFKAIREQAAAALRSLLAQLGCFPPLSRSSLPDLLHWLAETVSGTAFSSLFGLANILLAKAETPVWL